MKKSLYSTLIALVIVGIPSIVFAIGEPLGDTTSLVNASGRLVSAAIGVLSALALLVFIWGIVKYISSAGDEDKAKEGKSIMIYGVIALFVLFSVFGLIRFLRDEFNINQNGVITGPQFN